MFKHFYLYIKTFPLKNYTQFRTMSNLIITSSCATKIKEYSINTNTNFRLRISVNSGGCSGFQYKFNMDQSKLLPNDIIVKKYGIEVVTDDISYEYIKNSTIDYDNGMMRSAFIVQDNPQSESACGCGSSFAKKSFENNSAMH
jgi:iron-sulfur cluster assembly accessory protein